MNDVIKNISTDMHAKLQIHTMFILHVYTQPSLVEEGRLLQVFMMFHFFSCATRDDIFTCAQKLTYVILIHRTEPTTKTWEKRKKTKKRICSEVSANSPRGIRGVSPGEEKEGYGGKDLQKSEAVMDDESGESM